MGMLEAAHITTVLRTLADPTRRAVFERVVGCDEITVVELTRGSGVTQGAISQHLKSLKLAGLVVERPEGRNVYYRARPEGLHRSQVLQVVPNQRLAYAWKGGHAGNAGYGSLLDTVVTWMLTKAESGTRVRLVHSGFVLPKNDTAYQHMSNGWRKVVRNLD